MSLIIRIVFIVLCAYAGSAAGGAQFGDLAAPSQSTSE
jgi:hypothetical protein